MWFWLHANGNSFCIANGNSHGVSHPFGGERALPSLYVRLLTVAQMPDVF